MVSAWKYTVQKRLGLFSITFQQTSPLAAYEGLLNQFFLYLKILYITCYLIDCSLEPNPPFVKPHGIWIQFISDLVETIKYSSYEKVEMIASLIHHSLVMSVGAEPPSQTRHTAAVGVRFK